MSGETDKGRWELLKEEEEIELNAQMPHHYTSRNQSNIPALQQWREEFDSVTKRTFLKVKAHGAVNRISKMIATKRVAGYNELLFSHIRRMRTNCAIIVWGTTQVARIFSIFSGNLSILTFIQISQEDLSKQVSDLFSLAKLTI